MQNTASPLGSVLIAAVLFALIAWRVSRMTGTRPMRLHSLWIRPAIYAVLAGALIYAAPPRTPIEFLILAATLAVGAMLGWHQAKLMAISVDPATGTLQVKASAWVIIVFLAVILARTVLRTWLLETTSPVHAYLGVVMNASLVFVVGLYCARATEMFLRGRALLTAHRGA